MAHTDLSMTLGGTNWISLEILSVFERKAMPTKAKNFSCHMELRKDYAKKKSLNKGSLWLGIKGRISQKENLFTLKWIIF